MDGRLDLDLFVRKHLCLWSLLADQLGFKRTLPVSAIFVDLFLASLSMVSLLVQKIELVGQLYFIISRLNCLELARARVAAGAKD